MAKLPYMPLYVDDYEAATAHLTVEEDGIYNRLLRLCWRTPGCSIPNDDNWIERQMRMRGKFLKIKPILTEFFKLKQGRWTQKKQRVLFCSASSTFQARSAAGKKGAIAKALKTKEKGSSKASNLNKPGLSNEQATRTIKNKKEIKKEINIISGPLPDDFPDADMRALAIENWEKLGMDIAVETVASRFRNYYGSRARCSSDWAGDWLRWCYKERGPRLHKVSSAPPDPWENRLRGFRDDRFWIRSEWGADPDDGDFQRKQPEFVVALWNKIKKEVA